MSDWNDKKNYSMSFKMEADETMFNFLNRTIEELKDFEHVMNARIKQLFDENIGVGGEKKDDAYDQVLKVFMIGYGHGWNDRKALEDKS